MFRPPSSVHISLTFDPAPSHLDVPRRVLLLRLTRGLSIRQIARELGVSPGKVWHYYRQAVGQLAVPPQQERMEEV